MIINYLIEDAVLIGPLTQAYNPLVPQPRNLLIAINLFEVRIFDEGFVLVILRRTQLLSQYALDIGSCVGCISSLLIVRL